MSNVKTLNRTEAELIQKFIWEVDNWVNTHGEPALSIHIQFVPSDDEFDITTGEPPQGRKGTRTTRLRASITQWAYAQLTAIEGYSQENKVTSLVCEYKDGQFSVACEVMPREETVADDESEDAQNTVIQ